MAKSSSFIPEKETYRSTIVIILLVLITFAVYHDISHHSFIDFDDYTIITKRIDKYDGINLENIKDIIFDDYPREEPLVIRDLSYLINAEIFGELNPFGYLLGNLLLHIISAYLIYRLCLYLLPGQSIIAIFAAVIFAIHPINVESVAWISSRKNPLFAVFLLLSLIYYIKFLLFDKQRYLFISAVLFPFALLSKAAAICLLPILISYRLSSACRIKWSRQETIFYGYISIATIIFVRWYTGIIQQYGIIEEFSSPKDWLHQLLSASEYIFFYITKIIAPITVSPFYDFPSPFSIYDNLAYLLVSLATIAVSFFICLYLFVSKKNNQALFLILLFLSALMPYLGLTDVGIYIADRYAYVSTISYAIGLAWLIHYIYTRTTSQPITKMAVFLAVIIYMVFFGLKSFQATKTWENTFSFWRHSNQLSPGHIVTYRGLINHLNKVAFKNRNHPLRGEIIQNAIDLGHEALDRFCPDENKCDNSTYIITSMLASSYALNNNHERSDYYYEITFQDNPNHIRGRYQYTLHLIERKSFQKAFEQIEYIENNAHSYKYSKTINAVRTVLLPMIPAEFKQRKSNNHNPAKR